MVLPIHSLSGRAGLYVYDSSAIAWQQVGKAGLVTKPIRQDDERGWFLGLVGFEPGTRSGMHQHQGVATSLIIDGALTDYQGEVLKGQVGINRKGATHDAMSYCQTVLVSRSEGPVSYLPDNGAIYNLHPGAHHKQFRNPDPHVMPDENITIDALPRAMTEIDGIGRQMIFDYAGTGDNHRMAQIFIRPETQIPVFTTTALTEFWVRGGVVSINGQLAWANCFVIAEPGTQLQMTCPYGALLLAWAHGPLQMDTAVCDVFGYGLVQ
jgi:ChrR Cupin-like domain